MSGGPFTVDSRFYPQKVWSLNNITKWYLVVTYKCNYGSSHEDRIFQSFGVDLKEHVRFALLRGSFLSLSAFLI